ncbi:MAG: hypothetical protein ACT4OX_17170 [Actinomycetota bacterium]
MWRRFRSASLAVAIALLVTVVDAQPAAAHGVGGLQPTNVETRLVEITPEVHGIDVRAIELGERLELRNRSDATVVVLGYDGEPYLRVGPDGVFENRRSPATFLNRTRTPTGPPPASYDAGAEPAWRRISAGEVVRWHDHRAHYMGAGTPAVANAAPGRNMLISEWEVTLVVDDGRRVRVRGDLRWIPGPALWPAIVGLVVAAVLVVAAARRWWSLAAGTALVLLVGAEVVHVYGIWDAAVRPFPSRLGANVYSFVAILAGLHGLRRVVTRSPYDAAPAALIGAITLAVAGGLADVNSLRYSQLPSTLPADVARALVVLALGLGAGVGVAAASRLRLAAGERGRISSGHLHSPADNVR